MPPCWHLKSLQATYRGDDGGLDLIRAAHGKEQ